MATGSAVGARRVSGVGKAIGGAVGTGVGTGVGVAVGAGAVVGAIVGKGLVVSQGRTVRHSNSRRAVVAL